MLQRNADQEVPVVVDLGFDLCLSVIGRIGERMEKEFKRDFSEHENGEVLERFREDELVDQIFFGEIEEQDQPFPVLGPREQADADDSVQNEIQEVIV